MNQLQNTLLSFSKQQYYDLLELREDFMIQ
jgi:hypothetical protein